MKTSTYLLLTSLMVVGLLLNAGPALAWPSDNMPHVGQTSACIAHLPSGTHLGATYTFRLCVGNSQATTWSATVIRQNGTPLTGCGLDNQPVSVNNFTCTGIPTGVYSVTVRYKVGTSDGPAHSECWYVAP